MRFPSLPTLSVFALLSTTSVPALADLPEPLKFVSPSVLRRVEDESNTALEHLNRTIPAAKKMVDSAEGILVIPRMFADGAIIGVAYGSGVLRGTDGKHTYYNAVVGPSTAYTSLDGKAVILIFSQQNTLLSFRSGLGWTDGVNGTLSLLENVTDLRRLNPAEGHILAIILGPDGLVRGPSLNGIQLIKVPVYMCGRVASAAADQGEKPC